MSTEPAELAAKVIAAINSRESTELEPLLDPDVQVTTGRSVHAGSDAVVAWAAKEYDNLVRRYEVDELRVRDRRVLVLGAVQYVWKDGGEVADSMPIALELELGDEGLRRLRLFDDVAASLSAFDD